MFQKKSKGLFAEVSPYQIRLARADRNVAPLQIEALAAIPVGGEDETRQAVEAFAGAQRGGFCQAVCGIYPADRFLHRFQTENAARTRGDDFAPKILTSELKRNPAETAYRLLYPASGKAYDPNEALSREILFVGAGRAALREEQNRLLRFGLYPTRLHLASVGLFGGARRAIVEEDMDASALILEINEESSYAYVVNIGGLALSHPIPFGISGIAERIQKELRLQDVLSARKVMLSKTFDFRDMASALLGALIGQVRASTGQFEVQTGKSVHYLYLPGLPDSLSWIGDILAAELGMEAWRPGLGTWLEKSGINLSEGSGGEACDYLALLSQMANLESQRS